MKNLLLTLFLISIFALSFISAETLYCTLSGKESLTYVVPSSGSCWGSSCSSQNCYSPSSGPNTGGCCCNTVCSSHNSPNCADPNWWSGQIYCYGGSSGGDSSCTAVDCQWTAWNSCLGSFDSAIQIRAHSVEASCSGNGCSGDATQSCTLISSAVWSDLAGTTISSSSLGDSVFMKINGLGIKGQNINYTINVKEGSLWKNLLEFFGLMDGEFSSTAQTSNSVYKITNDSDHYYTAKSVNNNGPSQMDSGTLGISGSDNFNPVVIINSPATRIKTSTDYNNSFTQSSYDKDDLLNVKWSFGDNSNQNIPNYAKAINPTSGDIVYSYNQAGLMTVILNVSEMTRSQSNATSIVIEVLKPGINVIAGIGLPINGAIYDNQHWVNFSANNSYVANCSLTNDYSSNMFIAGNLYCTYIHAPGTKIVTGNYDILLNWTVYEQDSRGNQVISSGFPRSGFWNTTSELSAFFDLSKTRQAILSVNYLG